MKPRHKAAAAIGLLSVAGILAWVATGTVPSGGGAVSRIQGADADARLAALEAKVDRLAALLEADAGARRGLANPRPVAIGAQRLDDRAPGTGDAATQAQALARFETEFASERTDPVWSRNAEQQLDAIGTSDAILAIEAEPPTARQVECRTRRCRLSFDFGNAADAEDWSIAFSTSSGRALNRLVYFVTPLPDGRARVTMHGSR